MLREGLATGIDVSKWQGSVNWDQVCKEHVFGFARVSDGITKDPFFDRNWEGMKKSGIIRGCYQYFRPGLNAVEQARLMLDSIGKTFEPGDIPPVLDIESKPEWCHESELCQMAHEWAEEIENHLLLKPIIYGYPYFMNQHLSKCQWVREHELWLAHYLVDKPSVPSMWHNWTFWQWNGNGRSLGVSGKVDLNVFNGNDEDLAMKVAGWWKKWEDQ